MAPSDIQGRRFIELRKHRRVATPPGSLLSFVRVAENRDEIPEGDGTILNLSPGGCKISSDTPVSVGHTYSLIIQLPSFPTPVTIDSAIVRWIGENVFGFKFDTIRPEQEEQLREYLRRLRATAS